MCLTLSLFGLGGGFVKTVTNKFCACQWNFGHSLASSGGRRQWWRRSKGKIFEIDPDFSWKGVCIGRPIYACKKNLQHTTTNGDKNHGKFFWWISAQPELTKVVLELIWGIIQECTVKSPVTADAIGIGCKGGIWSEQPSMMKKMMGIRQAEASKTALKFQ